MKTGAVIQARMGSTRLPGKVMKQVLARPLLHYLLERVKQAKKVDTIIVATSTLPGDRIIVDYALGQRVNVFQGSEADVLDRYYQAAKGAGLDLVVRLTADCPLLDGRIVDWFIDEYKKAPAIDYMGTAPTFPEGYDMEIFTMSALERTWLEAERPSEREHVTAYMWGHPEIFKAKRLDYPGKDLSSMRVTVDEPEDFLVVSEIIESLYPGKPLFDLDDIVVFLQSRPDIVERTRHVVRNEGYQRSILKEADKVDD